MDSQPNFHEDMESHNARERDIKIADLAAFVGRKADGTPSSAIAIAHIAACDLHLAMEVVSKVEADRTKQDDGSKPDYPNG